MAYIPCKIGGGTEKPTLLWTNPSPNSNFLPQTLSINLTDYEWILISIKNQVVSPQYVTTCAIPKITDDQVIGCPSGQTGSNYAYSRIINMNNNGITFQIARSNYSGYSGNDLVIPFKIYGLKKALI